MLINTQEYIDLVDRIKQEIVTTKQRIMTNANRDLIILNIVVIELKMKNFEPEYAGKLNFYVSAVDKILKHSSDNPTIGILLCKKKPNLLQNTLCKT